MNKFIYSFLTILYLFNMNYIYKYIFINSILFRMADIYLVNILLITNFILG